MSTLMKIKMLRNKMGSPDGVVTKHYVKDEVYSVPEGLAVAFIAEKDAEAVAGKKSEGDAPENKAAKAENNKAAK